MDKRTDWSCNTPVSLLKKRVRMGGRLHSGGHLQIKNAPEGLGMRRCKTYRIYEKPLSASQFGQRQSHSPAL
jgi:hypothetical protein